MTTKNKISTNSYQVAFLLLKAQEVLLGDMPIRLLREASIPVMSVKGNPVTILRRKPKEE